MEDARLYEVIVVLKSGSTRERHWAGIPNKEVRKIQAHTMGSSYGTVETLTRDLLVQQLGRADTNFCLVLYADRV